MSVEYGDLPAYARQEIAEFKKRQELKAWKDNISVRAREREAAEQKAAAAEQKAIEQKSIEQQQRQAFAVEAILRQPDLAGEIGRLEGRNAPPHEIREALGVRFGPDGQALYAAAIGAE